MKRLIFSIVAVLLTAACAKDDVLLRNEQDMVLVVDGKLLTDNGLTFTVVQDDSDAGWEGWQRALVTCDVLRKTSDTGYEVRLTAAQRVLLKDAVEEGELSDEEMGDDPIDIVSGWIAGDYLNLLTRVVFDPDSGQAHFINLVWLGEEDGVVRFRLRHNSFGYYFGAPDVVPPVVLGSSFVTFPVGRFLPEGAQAAEAEVIWKWHVSAEGGLAPETQERSARFILRK